MCGKLQSERRLTDDEFFFTFLSTTLSLIKCIIFQFISLVTFIDNLQINRLEEYNDLAYSGINDGDTVNYVCYLHSVSNLSKI